MFPPGQALTLELVRNGGLFSGGRWQRVRLEQASRVCAAANPERLQLIRFSPPEHFYTLLRMKLGWAPAAGADGSAQRRGERGHRGDRSMLSRLTVRDLALVDHCSLELRTGLTLLSGETGSGKSLLIDALGLALGARARTGQVRQGAPQALVEAQIRRARGTLSLRRTVGARGWRRHRRLDGPGRRAGAAGPISRGHPRAARPAGLAEPEAQARLLDALAGALAERDQVAAAYGGWESARVRLAGLRQASARACEEQEFDLWRLRRLREVDPRPGEDDDLRVERNRLRNATRLMAAIAAAQEGLNADRGLSQAAVAVVAPPISIPACKGSPGACRRWPRRPMTRAAEIRRYGETLEADPARLEQVEARLALLDELKHRHGGTLEAGPRRAGSVARRRWGTRRVRGES